VTRLAVAATLWDLPLVRTPKLDSAELLSWAQRLASGDWTWPAVAQHGPGYPVFLAALLTATGGSLKAAIVMQALLGACTAVLVALSARNVFGDRAGLFAGLAYAVYGPAVYVDTAILSEGLLLFLLATSVRALTAHPLTMRRAVMAGAAFGAAVVVRPTSIIIAGAIVVWMLMRVRPAFAAACAATALVVIAPVVGRNWTSSHTLGIQGYGGLNAYIGNSPNHDGRATFRLGGGWDALNSEAARAGIRDPVAQDRYYLAKTWREIAERPAAFARLLAVKVLWLVQSEEARDSHSYDFFVQQSPLLRLLPRWPLLFPLAVFGILWAVPGTDLFKSVPGTYLIGAAASVVLLVVGFRYRMPVVLGLTMFAGAGLDRLAAAYARRAWRDLAWAAAACAAALIVSLILHDPRNANLAEEWAFTGSSLVTEHRLAEADAAYRRALELDPQSGLAWDGFGLTNLNAGRLGDARSAFERALAIDADSSRSIYHLAIVDDREGKLAQAVDGYERALERSPFAADITADLVTARRKLATELATTGRTQEALQVMQRLVALTPADGDAWLDLSLLSLDVHDADAAAKALTRARALGADPAKLQFAQDALNRLNAAR
jgi:Flp pilus assembly protein TadD